MATLLSAPTATPSQAEGTVVLTSGSAIRINTSARQVFQAITDTGSWSRWNSWCPSLVFGEGGSITQAGSTGTLHCRMEAQQRSYDIPIRILEVTSVSQGNSAADRYSLSWQAMMLPAWFALAERVYTVQPVSEAECELRQWESMSGWGVYVLKWVLGIEKQLNEQNLLYAANLKKYVEENTEYSGS